MLLRRFLSSASRLPPTIRQLLESPPEPSELVQVNGWVKSVRQQKNVAFAVVSDGSSSEPLQAVITDMEVARQITNGASVRLQGKLTDHPLQPGLRPKELRVTKVDVVGDCDAETYPIQKHALPVEYLRDHCHLRARTGEIGAMLRLRNTVNKSVHDFFQENGFVHIHTPIITSNDCEGAGETFRIAPQSSQPPPSPSSFPSSHDTKSSEYFNSPAYLTVSSQLHLEAIAFAISRVYTLSPCFRAERSQTSRHLAEFHMLEAEMAFTNSLDDVCTLAENTLRHILRAHAGSPETRLLLQKHKFGIDVHNRLQAFADAPKPWARMTYTKAIDVLAEHHAQTGEFVFPPTWGSSLQSEHERWLAGEHARGPVFVTDYPASLKPFYMRLNGGGGEKRQTVACFDLLLPGMGEIAGGSLREERPEFLEAALKRHGLDMDAYRWYLELRKWGGAPHGGFGLGFERLISWMGGIESVKECTAMPRWAGRMLL